MPVKLVRIQQLQDCLLYCTPRLFKNVKQRDNHPLKVCLLQEKKNVTYNLRRKSCERPKINTERYKNTFINILIFKYNLL